MNKKTPQLPSRSYHRANRGVNEIKGDFKTLLKCAKRTRRIEVPKGIV